MIVVYSEKMVPDMPEITYTTPSPWKPKKVVDDWNSDPEISKRIDVTEPEPATIEDFELAHDPNYITGIFDGTKENGCGGTAKQLAVTLPYTTGAEITAAMLALEGNPIVCAPVSGFHHAGIKGGWIGSFCTFNGLIVTALKMIKEGRAEQIAILDCDLHYGDGTDDIIKKHGLTNQITHYSAGEAERNRYQAMDFLEELPTIIADKVKENPNLVLYQAGADPHVNDRYRGWLDTEQLRQRDRIVFRELIKRKIPVVWNLAGGYQWDSDGGISVLLEIHRNTMIEGLKAMGEMVD